MPLPQTVLPDFRNLGVLLRVLLLAEGLRLLVWWIQAPGGAAGWSGYLEQALLYGPPC